MNNEAMKEILNELFSHLERLETQSEAILQFLKEKKRVTEKQLAPYLELQKQGDVRPCVA
jgi:predicted HTH transcriptional regulator